MPYSSISELPEAVQKRYSPRCLAVFMRVFNSTPGDEGRRFQVAHTAAGNCAASGKAEPMKAAPLDPDELEAWFAGRIPRRLLAIPFSGPIPGPSGKSRDLDGEFFDERTDIKPNWFDERPIDWHHSKDPYGVMNGVLVGKARNLHMDEAGWWVDAWLNHGEQRLTLLRKLAEKGAELFGSSYAYPNLVKRDGRTGHIDVWPYMLQTFSTAPQNTHSVMRPAKAALDAFNEADIAISDSVYQEMLTALNDLRDLPVTFGSGEPVAKAGVASGADDELLAVLERISQRASEAKSLIPFSKDG